MKHFAKKYLSLLLAVVMVFSLLPVISGGDVASAATLTLAQLQEKFPAGAYWAHGSAPNNPDGYSWSQCNHPRPGASLSGADGCNSFDGGIQCWGFALKLGYDYYGGSPRNWTKNSSTSALNSLKAGDIINYKNDGHTIFVTGVSGDTITYGDCNSDGHDIIRWNQTITKATVKSTFTDVRVAPYELSVTTIPDPSLTTDTRYKTPFQAYLVGSSDVTTYKSNLSSVEGEIWTTDLCTVTAVYTNGWSKVTYPVGSGTKIAYVQTNKFIYNTASTISSFTAAKKIAAYKRSNLSESFGNVEIGDACYIVSTSGNNSQIIYPVSGGYKLGWIQTSAMKPALPSTSANIANGTYKIQHKGSGKYISAKLSKENSVIAYIWDWEDHDDQKFDLERQSDNTYKIASKYSSKALDVFNSEMNDGANVIQYTWTGTDNQRWYIVDCGSGYYKFVNKNSGLVMDILGNSTANGGTIQQFIDNGTDAQRFKLTAVVTTTTYTISYNANGGSGAPTNQTKTNGVTLTLSSVKPSKSGYIFQGWSTSSTATSATYQPSGSFATDANTTLYAVWKAEQYTISYNANGGSGAPSNQTKNYGSTLSLSTVKPTRSGYTFIGWSTISNATSATYQPGDICSVNAAITLYAVWKADEKGQYLISYSANGGENAPNSQTKTEGINLTLSSTKPVKSGNTFLGWSTSSTAILAEYQPGDTFTSNANITLYAVWKAGQYTITYNANGGNSSPNQQIKTHDSPLTLSSTIPNKDSNTFLGWSINSAAVSAEYQAGDSFTLNANTTLYAVWQLVFEEPVNEPNEVADEPVAEPSEKPQLSDNDPLEIPVDEDSYFDPVLVDAYAAGTSSWATESVKKAIEMNLSPVDILGDWQANITREEFCRMVIQMLMAKSRSLDDEQAFLSHFGITNVKSNFSDTSNRYVNIAYELKVVSGTGNGKFTPYGDISRQEAATMLRNAAAVYGFTTYSGSSIKFSDIDAVATWALGGVNFTSATKIMSGTGNNMFSPIAKYSREQAIITMLNLFNAFPRDYYALN